MKKVRLSEQDLVDASTRAANRILIALSNYRATDPSGVRIEILSQRDLPPAFTAMCQGLIAREVRAMLDGIFDDAPPAAVSGDKQEKERT